MRVVVVDGEIGYTGGFGLADYWLGDGHHEDQWRESNVRFEGPAVMQLQAAFARGVGGVRRASSSPATLFFPRDGVHDTLAAMHAGLLFALADDGQHARRALPRADDRRRAQDAVHHELVLRPRRRLPPAARSRARKRGVDVRILTVSEKTDVKTTWYAGRSRYEELLEGGDPDLRVPADDDPLEDDRRRRACGARSAR